VALCVVNNVCHLTCAFIPRSLMAKCHITYCVYTRSMADAKRRLCDAKSNEWWYDMTSEDDCHEREKESDGAQTGHDCERTVWIHAAVASGNCKNFSMRAADRNCHPTCQDMTPPFQPRALACPMHAARSFGSMYPLFALPLYLC
jgi:hypothetical protein